MTVDSNAIKQAVLGNSVYEISNSAITRETEQYYDDVFLAFLKECGLENLHTGLSYCLKELIGNAGKANIKRVYFEEKHLNISDKKQYADGMLTFSLETTVRAAYYKEQVEKKQYYIKMALQKCADYLSIEIKNNAVLTDIEKERVQERIRKSKIYNSMEEALEDIDKTEGSGLGIIIIILTLNRLGYSKDCFTVDCDGKETVSKIILKK